MKTKVSAKSLSLRVGLFASLLASANDTGDLCTMCQLHVCTESRRFDPRLVTLLHSENTCTTTCSSTAHKSCICDHQGSASGTTCRSGSSPNFEPNKYMYIQLVWLVDMTTYIYVRGHIKSRGSIIREYIYA